MIECLFICYIHCTLSKGQTPLRILGGNAINFLICTAISQGDAIALEQIADNVLDDINY
jgi:hypothetical protein